jgi:hypothetical protein
MKWVRKGELREKSEELLYALDVVIDEKEKELEVLVKERKELKRKLDEEK